MFPMSLFKPTEKTHTKTLFGVLYLLHHISEIDEESVLKCINRFMPHPRKMFSRKYVRSVLQATEWALAHEDFNFKALNPELKFSNAEIFYFLKIFHSAFRMRLDNPLPYKKKNFRKP